MMQRSGEFELRQSARLIAFDFRRLLAIRVLLLLAVVFAPLPAGLALAFVSELIGRYLFFVAVVPRNMATTFFGTAREAA
jgi:hypothetical protein